MPKKIMLPAATLSLLVLALIAWMGFSAPGHKPYYVSTPEVYQAFELTQTLNAEYEKVAKTRQLKIDSLQSQLRQLAVQLDEAGDAAKAEDLKQFEGLRNYYLQTEQQIEQDNQALAAKYDEQIRSQLNTYIQAFGEARALDVLLGAQGQGNLLYARESYDLTGELIEYVNHQYQDEDEN
ncbi:MAG: OmpH family outer membrane protein [Salibacteraceae bacterium]